jgi:outer membrane protein TolC
MKAHLRTAVLLLLLLLGRSGQGITLDAALARTLENNAVIQDAKLRLEEASGRRLILRATGLPDARMNAPVGVQGGHRSGEDQTQPFAFVQGYLRQPVFKAGVPAAYRRGDIEVLLAQQRLNVAVLEQLHAARLTFYTAVHDDSLRALGEEQRLRLTNNVRAQTERYEVGEAQRAAVTVARVLEQELTPRLEESRRISNTAMLKLAQLMGEDLGPGKQLPVAEGGLQFAAVSVDVASEAAAAAQERPDL